MSIEEALLKQKLEFMQVELEESRAREETLKKLYHSVMGKMNSSDASSFKVSFTQDQTIAELQTANKKLLSDLKLSKKKLKEAELKAVDDTKQLIFHNRELQLEVKELKVQMQELNFTHERHSSYSSVIEPIGFCQGECDLRWATKLKEANAALEAASSEYEAEVAQLKQSHEHTLTEFRAIFNEENTQLRQQIINLQAKLKAVTSPRSPFAESNTSVKNVDAYSINLLHQKVTKLEKQLEKKATQIKMLKLQLEATALQKERAQIELSKALLEHKPLGASLDKRLEIRELLGTLLKAKGRTSLK